MSERPSNIPADVWALTEVDAKERADWLVDAVATATQNPAFLRGDDTEDTFATEAIKLNGEKAIRVAMCRGIIAERERCSALLNNGCTLEDGEPIDPAVPEIFYAINQGLRP